MRKRRFVSSKIEDAAKTVGSALLITGLAGYLLEPSIGLREATPAVIWGLLVLAYGTTEVHE